MSRSSRRPGEEAVAGQYEDLPYPPRDPADEDRRLVIGSPSHQLEINHYCFAGRRDWSRPFRVLVAGGGTGDALIMLATQLAATRCPAEITYIDLSSASRAIAEARAAKRKLPGITFLNGSILDLPNLAPGPFDYIDCCGVLHHLTEPAAGLAALAAVLAPHGGMGLMLYGSLGRTGVYDMQRALRLLANDADRTRRVAMARALLGQLPESNWFRRNTLLGDHKIDDAALYDLLLHSQDSAYRVPEIAALLAEAGLEPAAFIEPMRYDPLLILPPGPLRERAASLPDIDRAALAEDLSGTLKTHVLYAVKSGRAAQCVASVDDPALIPVWRETDARTMAMALSRPTLNLDLEGNKYRLPAPEGAADIARLIDGQRSLRRMAKDLGLGWRPFLERFEPLYRLLNGANLLLLRA